MCLVDSNALHRAPDIGFRVSTTIRKPPDAENEMQLVEAQLNIVQAQLSKQRTSLAKLGTSLRRFRRFVQDRILLHKLIKLGLILDVHSSS